MKRSYLLTLSVLGIGMVACKQSSTQSSSSTPKATSAAPTSEATTKEAPAAAASNSAPKEIIPQASPATPAKGAQAENEAFQDKADQAFVELAIEKQNLMTWQNKLAQARLQRNGGYVLEAAGAMSTFTGTVMASRIPRITFEKVSPEMTKIMPNYPDYAKDYEPRLKKVEVKVKDILAKIRQEGTNPELRPELTGEAKFNNEKLNGQFKLFKGQFAKKHPELANDPFQLANEALDAFKKAKQRSQLVRAANEYKQVVAGVEANNLKVLSQFESDWLAARNAALEASSLVNKHSESEAEAINDLRKMKTLKLRGGKILIAGLAIAGGIYLLDHNMVTIELSKAEMDIANGEIVKAKAKVAQKEEYVNFLQSQVPGNGPASDTIGDNERTDIPVDSDLM